MATRSLPRLGLLTRTTTPERVAALLTQAILTRAIAPSAQLIEVEVAAEFGVSRNTVREAFRILGREGLVEHAPYRGVSVRAFTPVDVADIYRARRMLEVEALKALPTASAEALAALAQHASRFDTAVRSGRWQEASLADIALHAGLVGLIGSPRFDAMMHELLLALRLAHFVLPKADAAGFRRSQTQHRSILRALQTRNRAAARSAVLLHLDESERLLIQAIEDQDSEQAPSAGGAA